MKEDIEEFKEDNMIKEEDAKLLVENFEEKFDELVKSKLSMFLTPTNFTNIVGFKTAAKLYAPYGALHAGFLLDCAAIEWGCGLCGSSLIFPNFDISDILMTIELKDENIWQNIKNFFASLFDNIINFFTLRWDLLNLLDGQLDIIAKLCVEYNRKHSYNPLTDNCQTFFQELLKRLSISREFKGELKKVIDKLMSKGEIIDFFFKDKIFKTRKDLDYFLEEIKFDSLCQEDKILLLSYRNTYNLILKNAKKMLMKKE
jgi:hypothetical protein